MASVFQCPSCGSAVRTDQKKCPHCGAENQRYMVDAPAAVPQKRTVNYPKTIEELKKYCAERGMPLPKMRFFIDQNYTQPKAFGIYRDRDEFVVYKNKADGSRAIRYRGPNEAHAVNELFQKLLQECHNRGIYPDGRPSTRSSGSSGSSSSSAGNNWLVAFITILGIIVMLWAFMGMDKNKKGYYKVPNRTGIYYHIGSEWFHSSSSYDAWSKVSEPSYPDLSDYYLGRSYSSSWGVSNFTSSKAYDDYQDRHSSSSSDYDSWDSSDTDWDSDW